MQLLSYLIGAILLFTGIPQKSFTYLQDKGNDFAVADLQHQTFQTTTDNNLGVDNGIYWFKIATLLQERSILELRTAHVNNVKLFDKNGKEVTIMSDTRYPSFFIVAKNVEYPLYLKANFNLEAHFPIYISDEAEFAKDEKYSLLSLGFFYGTALALIMATIIFFLITKNRRFVFYGLLIFALCISVMARDNILYLFGIKPNFISSLELIGHYLVGLSATGFLFLYLRLRKKTIFVRYVMIFLSVTSTLFLVTHLITKSHWSFIVTDVTSVLTTITLWAVGLLIVRNFTKRVLLFAIYFLNIFVLIDAFVLHTLGFSLVQLSPEQVIIAVLINFTLIALILIFSFRGIQGRTVVMKHQIRKYIEQLSKLDNYKNVQDANDDYLESLIYQFKLENIEVKVLDGISKGQTNDYIAKKLNLSPDKLQKITAELYQKLGLETDDDLNALVPS